MVTGSECGKGPGSSGESCEHSELSVCAPIVSLYPHRSTACRSG
jgi:hypothetical protein